MGEAPGPIRLVNLVESMAPELAAIELACFPMANSDDLFGEDDIRAYARVFPEGYFVALEGDTPVGMGAGIFLDFDFSKPQHTIAGITGEHQCGNHDPEGEWYYGTDITVLPAYRGRGIGGLLYAARKDLVRRYGKRGIIAGGSLPGFYAHKSEMTIEEYVDAVVRGEIRDPTLSFQLDNGFEVRGLLENYIDDEADDGWATLIVWEATTDS
ncbi:MAG: GNAT family N-acetyltransferase [Acidimicrobiia bacterium]